MNPSGKNNLKWRYIGFIAILFLMFDVETVLLFPWAVVAKGLGTGAILAVAVFLGVLVLGLAYAWKKGALQWK